jgi:hypothetical protein
MSLPSLSIVVSIGGERYLDLFLQTYKTWNLKEELSTAELIIFTNGVASDGLKAIRPHKHIPWAMKGLSMREQMINAFVFAANHIETDYYLKIDVDCFFTDDRPLLTREFFDHDITAHRWGYTKPAIWLNDLYEWAQKHKVPGESISPSCDENLYNHPRFTSWLCLHRKDFILKCLKYCDRKLPIPSHDTFLWFMADRLGASWRGVNFKNRGAYHSKSFAQSATKESS